MQTNQPDFNATFQPGQILDGRYRVLELLGQGGMGKVYKVEQVFLGSALALKTISDTAISDINIRRFQAEAKATSALKHPNIIAMHDFGLLSNQMPFLAMEFAQGRTLESMLRQGPLLTSEALDVFLQICAGLTHAHARGVVHRDIKPSNIMILDQLSLSTEGSVKILDFGIAKLMQNEAGEIQALTRTGEIFGSPLYMSPEQCSGGIVDYRSDIYSLGCVLFETLTGTAPFVGENALATMMLHQSSPIPSLKEASLGAEFPKELQQVVQTMLAKEQSRRYQRLTDALDDLAAIKRGQAPNKSAALIKTDVPRPPSANFLVFGRTKFWSILAVNAVVSCVLSAALTYGFIAAQESKKIAATKVETMASSTAGMDSPVSKTASLKTENPKLAEEIANKNVRFQIRYVETNKLLKLFEGYKIAQLVDINSGEISDDGLKYLKDSNLLSLSLQDCPIKTIQNLTLFPNLQYLDLKETHVDDKVVPIILSLKQLHQLNIGNTNISEDAILKIAESKSIKTLFLKRIPDYSKEFYEKIRKKLPQCKINGNQKSYLGTLVTVKDLSNATAVYEQKIDLMNRLYPKCSTIGLEKTRLAEIRISQKRWGEAKGLVDSANSAFARDKVYNMMVTPLLLRAGIADEQKDYEKYHECVEKAASYARETMFHDDPEYARVLFACSDFTDPKFLPRALALAKTGIDAVEQVPDLKAAFYERFLARIVWYQFLLKHYVAAQPYAEKYMDWTKAQHGENSLEYAIALIQSGQCALSQSEKKRMLIHGTSIVEQDRFHDKLHVLDHYCDACDVLVQLSAQANKPQDAINWSRKALNAAKKIKNDHTNREHNFALMLAAHLKRSGFVSEAKELAKQYQVPYDSLN